MKDTYTDRLSAYMDGELAPRDHAEVEAHLRACAACAATVAELREVAARAAALPDTGPSTDLWPGIAGRIARGPVVPFPARAVRRISFTIPQLVAAGLALMVLSGAGVWLARIGGDRADIEPVAASGRAAAQDISMANFADDQYDKAVADLEDALDAGRDRLDPQTVRVLEENLQAIDRAIEQSRQALSADPANLFLNTHLAASRKRKLALLRNATALATKG